MSDARCTAHCSGTSTAAPASSSSPCSPLTAVLGVLATGARGTAAPAVRRARSLHRNLALWSVVLLVLHVATAVVDTYVDIRWWQAVVPGSARRTCRSGSGSARVALRPARAGGRDLAAPGADAAPDAGGWCTCCPTPPGASRSGTASGSAPTSAQPGWERTRGLASRRAGGRASPWSGWSGSPPARALGRGVDERLAGRGLRGPRGPRRARRCWRASADGPSPRRPPRAVRRARRVRDLDDLARTPSTTSGCAAAAGRRSRSRPSCARRPTRPRPAGRRGQPQRGRAGQQQGQRAGTHASAPRARRRGRHGARARRAPGPRRPARRPAAHRGGRWRRDGRAPRPAGPPGAARRRRRGSSPGRRGPCSS